MYHTHLHDEEQLSGGLYGPLIVVEPGTKFDSSHDSVAVLSRAGPGPTDGPLLLNGSTDLAHFALAGRGTGTACDSSALPPSMAALSHCLALMASFSGARLQKRRRDLPPAQAVMQEARQLALAGEIFDFEYQPTVGWNSPTPGLNWDLKNEGCPAD